MAHRQWALSLPFSLRFQVVKRPEPLKRIEVRLVRAIWAGSDERPGDSGLAARC